MRARVCGFGESNALNSDMAAACSTGNMKRLTPTPKSLGSCLKVNLFVTGLMMNSPGASPGMASGLRPGLSSLRKGRGGAVHQACNRRLFCERLNAQLLARVEK